MALNCGTTFFPHMVLLQIIKICRTGNQRSRTAGARRDGRGMDATTKGGCPTGSGGPSGQGACWQLGGMPVRVIIADDRRLWRESLRLLIEANEPAMEVVEAVDSKDILSLLGSDEKPSILLYSVSGPASGGLGEVQLLRKSAPQLPIMVVCDVDDAVLARGAFAYGARAFLPATTPGPIMVAVLNLVIAGGQYAPPSLFFDGPGRRRQDPLGKSALAMREAAIGDAFPQLTRRQCGVLSLVSLGYSNRAIAEALQMRENTVKAHVKQIMRRLGVENRTRAALLADRLMT